MGVAPSADEPPSSAARTAATVTPAPAVAPSSSVAASGASRLRPLGSGVESVVLMLLPPGGVWVVPTSGAVAGKSNLNADEESGKNVEPRPGPREGPTPGSRPFAS